jgi:hypothetical protein
MRNEDTFTWPEPAVDRLKAMYLAGQSAAQTAKAISAEFGASISRLAVSGKINRLGLSRTVTQANEAQKAHGARRAAARNLKAPPVPKGPPNPVGANASRTYEAPPVDGPLTDRQKAVDAIAISPKVMLDPAWGGCRWPLYRTTSDGTPLSCCNDRPAGKQYCPGHHRLAFQATRPADAKANDAKTRAENVQRSGARLGATRHFNTPIAVAS